MKNKLSAEQVRIRTLTPVRAEDRLEVELEVVNQTDRPIFVVDRVRRIQLDPDSGVLHLWFSDSGSELGVRGPMRREWSPPKARGIERERRRTIKVSLPLDMTRLVVHDKGSFHLEALDLASMRRVAVHVAADTVPFYFRPTEKDLAAQVSAWGTDITAEADIEVPSKNREKRPDSAA